MVFFQYLLISLKHFLADRLLVGTLFSKIEFLTEKLVVKKFNFVIKFQILPVNYLPVNFYLTPLLTLGLIFISCYFHF